MDADQVSLQGVDRGPLEEIGDRELGAQLGANAIDELRREEGVPAELEEVVVHADLVEVQDVLPEAREGRFDEVARRESPWVLTLYNQRVELRVGPRGRLWQMAFDEDGVHLLRWDWRTP